MNAQAILQEFVADVEAVGDLKVQEEWPDLYETYLKAQEMIQSKGANDGKVNGIGIVAIDSTEVLRNAMIERRNKALDEANFDDAVLFSHVIATLAYCLELEAKERD